MNLTQMRSIVVEPALNALAIVMPQLVAGCSVPLMLGTGLVESGYAYLAQFPSGPAIGFWEMEAGAPTRTYEDTWANFLAYHPSLAIILRTIAGVPSGVPPASIMATNLLFGCAMARLKYYRSTLALPQVNALALATYHKDVYNTGDGEADITKNTPLFQAAITA